MSSAQNWIRKANLHMTGSIEYNISSYFGESEVVYADNCNEAIDLLFKIYGKKYVGYIQVYDKRFANVEITDVKYRKKYLFFLVKSKPTHKMYIVNYYGGTNEVYTCITSYKGQPMNLACKLLGIDEKHIKNVPVYNSLFSVEIMNLQTGAKYRYLTIPWSQEKLDAGRNKNNLQLTFEKMQFYELVKQNVLKSFPQVNEVDFSKYILNSYKFL